MYYDREDSNDIRDFINSCNARDLARELLQENEDDVTTGETSISPGSSLANQDVTITRTISYGSNNNQAIIEYDAERNDEVIATIKATLVPNAVHWCS